MARPQEQAEGEEPRQEGGEDDAEPAGRSPGRVGAGVDRGPGRLVGDRVPANAGVRPRGAAGAGTPGCGGVPQAEVSVAGWTFAPFGGFIPSSL